MGVNNDGSRVPYHPREGEQVLDVMMTGVGADVKDGVL